MSELKLYTSNRLEILAERLADKFQTDSLQSPLEQEIIIAQSRGMERWLSMELARHLGICANIRFPFPNTFVQEVFKKFIPDIPEESPFDPEILTWKIMKLMPNLIESSDFEDLWAYLQSGKTDLKLFQLAQRIADTFDQYTVFRPDMILRWDHGKGSGWQAKLWQHLSRENNGFHRAALRQRYIEIIRNGFIPPHDLPSRISVFGISALPPFHLQILASLANLIEVNLFLMNPCREFWDDIVSDRETDKITRRERSQQLSADELYLESGNSLLASAGALGRDFFWQIHQYSCQEHEFFDQGDEDSLLACVQSDILNLKERDGQTTGFKQILKTDNSVQVQSCHGPMREIEVLYDDLLAMFESDEDLKPKDILVMTPDIETYAPFVQAVFGSGKKGSAYIPFSIADRNLAGESPLIKSFMAILDLAGSRFEVSKVADILESPFIHREFGLAPGDVELILRWLKQARIRWGIDKQHRQKLCLPDIQENTWRAGLDRLLLGYAMPRQDQGLFGNILPYDNIEGDQAQTLGKLAEFIDRLIAIIESLETTRELDEWIKLLMQVCDQFFLTDNESDREMIIIRRVINNLGYLREKSGIDERISFDIINQYLKDQFARESSGFGFIAGAVTFCAMLPMRSIPFKVICLIGMNHDSYPHQEKHLSFDLIAKHPQRGDRSIRNSDRYLFLEAILSARRRLYISHVGQSIEDNSTIPPSVLVSELLDYINQGFGIAGHNILDYIVTKHRLQAFSPYYFSGDSKLFSYSEENYQAARLGINRRNRPAPFITEGLPEAGEEYRTIDIDQLCSFFVNPSKYLMRERLGIYLDETDSLLEDREPYEITGLEKYELDNQLLEKALAGNDIDKEYQIIKASGILPHGNYGKSIYSGLTGDIKTFVKNLEEYRRGDKLEPLTIDYQIAGFQLNGRLDNIYPPGQIQYRVASIKAKDQLKIWLKHLAYNIIRPDSYPANSILFGSNSCLEYSRVESAAEILKQLLDFYWAGLRKPLAFFPESSLRYAELLANNQTEEQALQKSLDTWAGTDFGRGEGDDDYYKICIGGLNPLDGLFQEIALQVYQPLMKYQTKLG